MKPYRLPGGEKNKGNLNREGKFYVRIYIPRPGQRPKQKLISLETENAREAQLRSQEVEKVKSLIQGGDEFIFPWMKGSLTIIKQLSLEQATKDYLSIRANEGLRPKTLQIFFTASNHLIQHLGGEIPIENITAEHIRDFIRSSRERLAPTTINMYLRSLQTFFRRCHEEELLQNPPRIRQVAQAYGLPHYLSNQEFNQIQDEASQLLADIFWFYREVGCRLLEPFGADLRGSYLIVPTENSKGKMERQIPLNHDLIKIYKELVAVKRDPKYYSKQFQAICRQVGVEGHKFHDLRHTFGVRTWLATGDLHLVSQLMGHKSIITTQIYTKFFISRLLEDFPDLAGFAENRSLGRAAIIGRGNNSTVENSHDQYTEVRIPKNNDKPK